MTLQAALQRLAERLVQLPILRKYHIARQFVKFGVIGVFNTGVDFGIYFTLTRGVDFFSVHKLLANALSFTVAVIGAFILNRSWTFRVRDGRAARQFVKFILVYLVGFTLNQSALHAAISVFAIHDIFGKLAGLFLNFSWNFFASRWWAFHMPRETGMRKNV